MSPPEDPFKPEPHETFSKRQVNKAGRLALDFFRWDGDRGEIYDHFDVDRVVDAVTAVTWWRSLHARPLSRVAANLRGHVARADALVDGRADVTQRLKRRETMIDKLRREPTMAVTQMEDIGGVRVRLPSLAHVYEVSRRLKKSWTIHRTRDYIARPKASGYRALHLIVRRDGRMIEVQLRTLLQDAWANQVEEDGHDVSIGFKFGDGPVDIQDYYVTVAEAFATVDRGDSLPTALIADLNIRYARIQGLLPHRKTLT